MGWRKRGGVAEWLGREGYIMNEDKKANSKYCHMLSDCRGYGSIINSLCLSNRKLLVV